jgi:hypothetical protein
LARRAAQPSIVLKDPRARNHSAEIGKGLFKEAMKAGKGKNTLFLVSCLPDGSYFPGRGIWLSA